MFTPFFLLNPRAGLSECLGSFYQVSTELAACVVTRIDGFLLLIGMNT